jgi:hypothetical protein
MKNLYVIAASFICGVATMTASDLKITSCSQPEFVTHSKSVCEIASQQLTPCGVRPVVIPKAEKLMVESNSDTAHRWGEWYEEMTGNFHASYSYASVVADAALNGYDIDRVSVMRRDDADDPDLAQLKISGILADADFYVYYVPSTGELYWDEQVLSVEVPQSVKEEIDNNKDQTGNPYATIHVKGIDKKGANNVDFYSMHEGLNLGNLAFLCADYYQVNCWFSKVRKKSYDDILNAVGWDEDKIYEGNTGRFHVLDNPDIKSVKYTVYHPLKNNRYECGGKIYENSEFMDLLNNHESDIFTTVVSPSQIDIPLSEDGSHYAYFWVDFGVGYVQFGSKKIYVINSTPDKWRSLGTGTAVMPSANTIMYNPERYVNEPQPVEVQQNMDNPDLIRLVNPWNKCYRLDAETDLVQPQGRIEYDAAHDYYMIFDIADPLNVYQREGCLPYRVRYKGTPYIQLNYWNETLTLEQGILTSGNSSETRYELPLNVSFSLSSDNNGDCFVEILSDKVARIYYTVFEPTATMTVEGAAVSLTSAVSNNMYSGSVDGYNFASVTQSGALPASWFTPLYKRPFRLVALSVDDNGAIISKEVIAPVRSNKPELYYAGECVYQERSIAKAYSASVTRYEVSVYLSSNAPGCYFLKNPYYNGKWPYNTNDYYTVATEDSYMMVDCFDPESVIISDYDMGIEIGNNICILHHQATDWVLAEAKNMNLTGHVEVDGDTYVISFPDNVFGLIYSNNGYWSYTNGPVIYIPISLNGIEPVIDMESGGNADKEYYTLQGIRVENPDKGIYIMRQGSKVSKIYVK